MRAISSKFLLINMLFASQLVLSLLSFIRMFITLGDRWRVSAAKYTQYGVNFMRWSLSKHRQFDQTKYTKYNYL